MLHRIITFILFLCPLAAGATAVEPHVHQPNVIIVLFDDMGYGDTEPYGMTGIPTPNINRLAEEGMRFTHFNAAQAVCTTSRAALLTGTYPNRLGLAGALLPGDKTALNPEEATIASLLKRAGYTTAMLGKWHLGNQPPYFPGRYGFDSFYGIPYSNDIWPMDYHGKRLTDPDNWRFNWPDLPLYKDMEKVGSVTSLEGQAKLTTELTNRAVEFIERDHKKPFFLYLAHPMPHVPLAVSDKFRGKSDLGLFGDVIMELDWSVGEIMKALDKQNLAKDTLLIVTSDNGPWLNFGDHAGSSGGLKEGKSTAWEGGTRVPMLVRWPDKIRPGGVYSELMTNMDLLPTIVAAAGASTPERPIDGINFLSEWLGQTNKGPRELMYYYFGDNNLEAVRYKHWKLVLPHASNTYTTLHGKNGVPGEFSRADVPMALYNLAHDPGEDYDVQGLYPEMVKQLQAYAAEARKDLGDSLTGQPGRNRREPARLP